MKGVEFFKLLTSKSPFSQMHPKLAAFFKDYLSNEKIVRFNDSYVLNTHFPPYPSRAFTSMVENFNQIGDVRESRLFSVTLAVTNRCSYNCWHCYNSGRNQKDVPLSILKEVAGQIQDMGAVTVTLTGGEPLLRDDLEEIALSFGARTCLKLNTTGSGLTELRAAKLHESGVFAIGVSLDSIRPDEHDSLRGKKGAFRTSIDAIKTASKKGLYPYFIAVGTREFLQPERFWEYMRFASEEGAREVHLLEPSATGKLAGISEILLSGDEIKMILDYQKEAARNEDMPILSTFTYLESAKVFGCGAGITHLYIDGSGEVCPCNLVPLSFGNIARDSLKTILGKMGLYFQKPRCFCAGKTLTGHIDEGTLPKCPEESMKICNEYLPTVHPVPRFFRVRSESKSEIGNEDVRAAYDRIHEFYDEFWLKEACSPTNDLLDELSLGKDDKVFEAGCGTGYATVLMAEKVEKPSQIVAADISSNMLGEAKIRAQSRSISGIQFIEGDAFDLLEKMGPFTTIFSSWVLGYIPLKPFFTLAARKLYPGGSIAFVVHKEHSPREPLQLFEELVAEDPSILLKKVQFDFPANTNHVKNLLELSGFEVVSLHEGEITFNYSTPEEVLEHLLKSGAGTAYYEAVDPARRESLETMFLKNLACRRKHQEGYKVIHDYISCVAKKIDKEKR
jgi:MoaA/NifB/PqqE/SkfB family radical SAM enzyme/ubiquinone/menaquinone biosynthesis C-methylase UbiE